MIWRAGCDETGEVIWRGYSLYDSCYAEAIDLPEDIGENELITTLADTIDQERVQEAILRAESVPS